jgi:predicted  nucleic acid-binding Zn-ribbon protein
MANASNPPANWYVDPQDSTQYRYWDGSHWTDHRAPATAEPNIEAPRVPALVEVVPDVSAAAPQGFPEPPAKRRSGLFGSKKGLEAEVDELRAVVDGFGYAERKALNDDIARLCGEQSSLSAEVARLHGEIATIEANLVTTREESILQEVGIYEYQHRLENSLAHKAELDSIRARIKEMSKRDGGAVQGATNWTVNNSAAQGRKMVREFSKLLLRAYNGEADVLVNKMRPYKLDSAIDQLNKARTTISRLGQTMNISITEPYHQVRLEELRLTADFLAKKEEEKEAEREERERLRDEAKARQQFEAEKARLLKEQAHYLAALERLRSTGTAEEIAAAEQELAEINGAIQGVEDRAANIRAGYVYVISNFGSFGENMVKIGMTRRLDPLDRVRELGDASVPFKYDVHALIFSDDAVSLELRLHQAFQDRRVNMVNLRREFFYATPIEVRDVLTRADGSVLEFVEDPEADEWHQSVNARRDRAAPAANIPDTTAALPPPPPLPV